MRVWPSDDGVRLAWRGYSFTRKLCVRMVSKAIDPASSGAYAALGHATPSRIAHHRWVEIAPRRGARCVPVVRGDPTALFCVNLRRAARSRCRVRSSACTRSRAARDPARHADPSSARRPTTRARWRRRCASSTSSSCWSSSASSMPARARSSMPSSDSVAAGRGHADHRADSAPEVRRHRGAAGPARTGCRW